MTHLSLFSGIGGIDLAAHWAGFKTVGFVEKEPFCQKILAKNFPGIPIHDDITTFTGTGFRGVDLVSAGFPCQGISVANSKARGLEDSRSRLVHDGLRIILESEPRWVVLENSPALKNRGWLFVSDSLEGMGYSVEAYVVGARQFGLRHERRRVFVVAHNDKVGGGAPFKFTKAQGLACNDKWFSEAAQQERHDFILRLEPDGVRAIQLDGPPLRTPVVCRTLHGIPNGVDRLRALGNAVVPQQVYPILKAIADYERSA